MADTEQPKKPETPEETHTELTLKELQAKAIELGIPKEDAEKFTAKANLLATINVLKANRLPDKVETITPPANPQEEKQIEKKWRNKAEKMRELLEKQPKVRFLIPLEGQEKQGIVREVMVKGRKEQIHVSGAVETVILNGYKTLVPKGVFVDLPEQVAQVLADFYRLTTEAGKDLLLDRVDPETGKPVRDQLV